MLTVVALPVVVALLVPAAHHPKGVAPPRPALTTAGVDTGGIAASDTALLRLTPSPFAYYVALLRTIAPYLEKTPVQHEITVGEMARSDTTLQAAFAKYRMTPERFERLRRAVGQGVMDAMKSGALKPGSQIDTTTVAGKNIAFVVAHLQDIQPLGELMFAVRRPIPPPPKPLVPPAVSPFRLTVRPREMATGTRTVKAGVDTLVGDSLRNYFVYVPKNCVGTRRVPLVVYVHGGGWNSTMQLEAQRDLADKYGMILLLPNSLIEGQQDIFLNPQRWGGVEHKAIPPTPGTVSTTIVQSNTWDARGIDTAMKYVLRRYAIDPEKIAVVGFSNGGSYALLLGRNNQDVFSRVGSLSAFMYVAGGGPQNDQTQFLVSGGFDIGRAEILALTQELRGEGHRVETVLALRGHIARREDDNYVWNWLARGWGWTTPASAHEGPPRVLPETDPLLTVDAVRKMTTFWKKFLEEPDAIKTVARKAHQEAIVVRINRMPVTVVKTNMVALAAKYPAVAADLKAAGLTVHEEEAYRAALIRTLFTQQALTRGGSPSHVLGAIEERSALGRNLAFMAAHKSEFDALDETGMWMTQ